MPRRRPLTLHVSALSDAEYASYTSSLAEVTSPMPDTDWEDITLGVREARGWIRGRYGAGVDGAIIDQILKNFCPDLGPHDILTGGQFFAVLRLVCHAQAGATVDDALVFVQANPEPISPSHNKEASNGRPSSVKSAPPPPPRPSDSAALTPTLPPRTVPPVPSPNPFTRSQSTLGPMSSCTRPVSQPAPAKEKHAPDPPISSNPFRQSQPQTQSKPSAPSLSSASSSSSSPSNPRQYAYASPPLPPRKPSSAALLPPPRHASLTAASIPRPRPNLTSTSSSKSFSLTTPPLPPPPKPPKPPQATSPLIKQSLQAAKGAQSIKEVMDGLRKERRWEVIKKSGGGANGGTGSGGSGSGSGGSRSGEGTPHRTASPPQSFYDVASARIERAASPSSYSSASASSPDDAPASTPNATPLHTRQLAQATTPNKLTPQFPFTHVTTPPSPLPPPSPSSTASPTQNAFPSAIPIPNPRRSKSLHHPSPASSSSSPTGGPPIPPPRRRRPESVQVMGGSPFGGGDASPFSDGGSPTNGIHARTASGSMASPSPLSRHLSYSSPAPAPAPSSSTHDSTSVFDTLHRTIATLRPGAGFESARIKAEGRVWPSGYVKGLAKGPGLAGEGRRREGEGAGARLVGEEDGGFGQDPGVGVDEDEEDGGGGYGYDGGGRGLAGRRGMERDELKMPVRPDEGWTAL